MADTAVASGLMPHQKDEHDIWICKDCGWKYPNAKPSPKLRKHHKKQCPGKSGSHGHHGGGSSDDASDIDEHSSRREILEPNVSTVPPIESTPRSLEFSPAPVDKEAPLAINGHAKAEDKSEPEASGTPVAVPVAATHGGLMPHQKDEHDIWICKDCGWKYPNARPSPKIRKHHKKQCSGKPGSHGHHGGGSSDDASDLDEHSSRRVAERVEPLNVPAAPPVESKPRSVDFYPAPVDKEAPLAVNGLAKAEEKSDPEASGTPVGVPVAASHGGLMPHQKDEHDIWICKDCGWKYPNAKPSPKIRRHHKKQCPGKGAPGLVTGGGSSDEASDDEHHHEKVSIPSAAPTESILSSQAETGSTVSAATEAPPDISREIDSEAPKELPGQEVTTDESTGVEATSPAPVAAKVEAAAVGPADVLPIVEPEVPPNVSKEMDFDALKKPSNPDVDGETTAASTVQTTSPLEGESGVGDSGIKSREVEADSAVQSSEAGVSATKAESPANNTESEQATGGLMPHQKDVDDIWLCKECGWKYPNARPSAKIRKNHKKKCTGKSGLARKTSDGDSDDDTKGGKCFPCL